MEMLRLWSEWDIGEDNLVFASKQALISWLHVNEAVAEMAAEEACSVEELVINYYDEGFFSDETLTVIN
jgi:hypothetical protein